MYIELITATYKYSDHSPIKQHSHLPNKTQNANFESYSYLSVGWLPRIPIYGTANISIPFTSYYNCEFYNYINS